MNFHIVKKIIECYYNIFPSIDEDEILLKLY